MNKPNRKEKFRTTINLGRIWVISLTATHLLFTFSCDFNLKEESRVAPIEQLIAVHQRQVFLNLNEKFFKNSKDIFKDSVTVSSVIKQLYKDSIGFWSDSNRLNEKADNFIEVISKSDCYGLDSNFYNLTQIKKIRDSLLTSPGDSELLTQGEWELTKSSLLFFTHVKYGFLNHEDKDSMYYQLKLDSLKKKEITKITSAIDSGNFETTAGELEPSFFAFRQLRKSWGKSFKNKLITSERIKVESMKEDSTKAYERAKKALILYGYLDTSFANIDSTWLDTLKKFQSQHGLSQDGRIGMATAKALSRSNKDRWLSYMATIEKMKWEPEQAKDLLYANIPSYTLKIVENNEIIDEYRTVVGKTINRTPTFSAKMSYLILNPFWHIPYSISSKEILPKLKNDSNLVKKKGYKIYTRDRKPVDATKVDWSKVSESSFNYRISQVRSGGTALGKVKFIFSNKYSIYFHDTPSKRLFKNDIRAYSHGCVRVQNPLKLASYLLSKQDTAFTIDSVQSFSKFGEQKRFNIDYNLKVKIGYFSTEGTKNGSIIFYRDIYRKDDHIKQEIESVVTRIRSKNNQ